MRFTFQATTDEMFRAVGAMSEITNRGNRIEWAVGAAFFVSFLVAMRIWPERWLQLAILLTVHTLLVLTALFFEGRIRIKRQIVADPAITKELALEVNAAGVRAEQADLRAEAGWSGIVRVHESPEFYLFFTGPFAAQWLPKRVIGASEGDLRALIRSHAADRGANLRPEGSSRR